LHSKNNFTKDITNLALTAMEILFLIALGLNPRQLKKDWNVGQENAK
jgi:hypothetical protein